LLSLALALLAFGVGFETVYATAELAANAALDTAGYIDAVSPATDAGPTSSVTHNLALLAAGPAVTRLRALLGSLEGEQR
jgi:multicomponent Na+:H+ antiporter subunit D